MHAGTTESDEREMWGKEHACRKESARRKGVAGDEFAYPKEVALGKGGRGRCVPV